MSAGKDYPSVQRHFKRWGQRKPSLRLVIGIVLVVLIVIGAVLLTLYLVTATLKVRVYNLNLDSRMHYELHIDGSLMSEGTIDPFHHVDLTFTLYPGLGCRVYHVFATGGIANPGIAWDNVRLCGHETKEITLMMV